MQNKSEKVKVKVINNLTGVCTAILEEGEHNHSKQTRIQMVLVLQVM